MVRFRTEMDELTELSAGTVSIHSIQGKLDSLSLAGSATARQVSDVGGESLVGGDSLAVLLREDRVHRLVASGRASCEHTASGEDKETISLTGDRVSVSFDEGKFRHADADGGVRGSYLPGEAVVP